MERATAVSSRMVTVIGFIAIIAASYFAKGLLLPLAMAALISLLLAPLVSQVERWGLGRGPAVGAVVLSTFLVVVLVGWVVSLQVPDLTGKLPIYRRNITEKIGAFGPAGQYVRRLSAAFEEMGQEVAASAQGKGIPLPSKNAATPPAESPATGFLSATLLSVVETLGKTVVILILVVFLLLYQSDLRDRMIHLAGHGQVQLTTRTMGQAAEKVSRYLLLQSAVNAVYGTIVGLGLWAFGVPNPILWGLGAAVFRFIPYVGPWLGALMPMILSLAVFSSWSRPGLLLGSWILVEAVTANVLEPWLYGERTGISPLAVVLAAIFWSWLWGGLGLILAVPLTVTLVVLGRNFPQLSFLNILLGSESSVSPKMQLYHRLLGRASDEAADLVDDYQKGKLLIDIYDSLLVPTLALAKTDHFQGTLDDDVESKLLASMRVLAEDLAERPDPSVAGSSPPQQPAVTATRKELSIVCIPASDESDAIIGVMLARLLSSAGAPVELLPAGLSVGETVERLAKQTVDMVVISALPPGALVPARYLYKRIRNANPNLEIVVGLWSQDVSASDLKARIGVDEHTRFATTLLEARSQVEQLSPGIALSKPVLLTGVASA